LPGSEPDEVAALHAAWRKLRKGRHHKPSSNQKTYLRPRIAQSGLQACILVANWAHQAESAKFWQDNDRLGIATLFKADKWEDRLSAARKWEAEGKPLRAKTGASEEEARAAWDRLLFLAATHTYRPKAEQVHGDSPDKGQAALSALEKSGNTWAALARSDQWSQRDMKQRFVAAYRSPVNLTLVESN